MNHTDKAHESQWARHNWTGSASDFIALDLPSARAVWSCTVSTPAIIIGSSQPEDDVDEEMARSMGLDVVKRRSGGGAVFVHPTESVWIDITISRDDPLWIDDVSESMLWLGEVFVRAVSPWIDASVYRGAYLPGSSGRSVCFASTSPGEVFVGQEKLVGISQRRTREGSRMQCVLYRHWNLPHWISAMQSNEVQSQVQELPVATLDRDVDEVITAVMGALP